MRTDKEDISLLPGLAAAFAYDPRTGWVTHRLARQRVRVGARAGTKTLNGYRIIKFQGRTYMEHRLAFALMVGRWPVAEIDHISGRRDDNTWGNLREATRDQNSRNNAGRRPGKLKGAYYNHIARKFQAIISIKGRLQTLGYHHKEADAHAAYMRAARDLVGEFARGGPSFLD